MTTFTTSQIRSAILRAADRIEREPGCYNFGSIDTPRSGGCGTPHCMLGWIGFELCIYNECITRVYEVLDISVGYPLYEMCAVGHTVDAGIAAVGMRAYADKYFPAEKLDAAYVAFRSTLKTMEGAQS